MEELLLPLRKLSRDAIKASSTMGIKEIRYLVDAYYSLQEYRKASANQELALGASGEPHEVISWLKTTTIMIEVEIKKVLDKWTDGHEPSRWAKGVVGIGPIIAAGLAAHIDITKAPTVGRIWRFAGLEPTVVWLGREKAAAMVKEIHGKASGRVSMENIARICVQANLNFDSFTRRLALPPPNKKKREGEIAEEGAEVIKAELAEPVQAVDGSFKAEAVTSLLAKRPWNADLKKLLWLTGESFVRFSGNPNDFYGKLYLHRKAKEEAKNKAGDYADQARQKLIDCKIGADTAARKAYDQGMLPQARIHLRAKRWAVKLFLSHYHHVAYECHFRQPPPKPYVMDRLGHVDMIAPPNWNGPGSV